MPCLYVVYFFQGPEGDFHDNKLGIKAAHWTLCSLNITKIGSALFRVSCFSDLKNFFKWSF